MVPAQSRGAPSVVVREIRVAKATERRRGAEEVQMRRHCLGCQSGDPTMGENSLMLLGDHFSQWRDRWAAVQRARTTRRMTRREGGSMNTRPHCWQAHGYTLSRDVVC